MKQNEDLTFFYFPRACSLAVHIALEESGLNYQRRLVDLRTLENQKEDYLALNPTGAIPALSIGEQTLTETHAILSFIADNSLNDKLLPACGSFERYKAHEFMNFLSSSVHTYIRSIFRSTVYAGEDPQTIEAVNAQGVRNLAKAINTIEQRLGNTTWALGETFSVVDCYLFIMYLWTTDERISSVPERPKWKALASNVWQRPCVQKIVAIEQHDRDYPIPL